MEGNMEGVFQSARRHPAVRFPGLVRLDVNRYPIREKAWSTG